MISIFEPVCTKREHAQFNAAMLATAHELSEDGEVVFFGDASHVDHVAECLPDSLATSVKFKAIKVAERHLRAFRKRFFIELSLLSKVWRTIDKPRCEVLIITGVTESSLLALKLFFIFRRTDIKVVLIFHSILSQFTYSKKRRFLLGAMIPKNVRYVVLGEHILDELEREFPWICSKMRSIAHPYLFDRNQPENNGLQNLNKFAFVGLGSYSKGFPKFLDLMQKFTEERNPVFRPHFYFIGSASADCKDLFDDFKAMPAASHLWYPASPGKMPLAEYRQMITKVDYLIMPHNPLFYKLVFSGSALDALALLKPIIVLKSPFFAYLFKNIGDVGYMCESIEEMYALISDIMHSPSRSRYAAQVKNLERGRSFFDPRSVALEMESILE